MGQVTTGFLLNSLKLQQRKHLRRNQIFLTLKNIYINLFFLTAAAIISDLVILARPIRQLVGVQTCEAILQQANDLRLIGQFVILIR